MQDPTIDILLIEDSLADADLIKEMLSAVKGQQYSVEHVQNLAQGLELLRGGSFDAILLDLGPPDSQGLETVVALRNQEKHTPVIVLTGLDDEEQALKTLEMDIQDYLIKSEITSSILRRSICYAIQRKHISAELRESEQRFASFMLNLPAAAWIKDMQGRYVYANAEAEHVFSMPLTALLGRADDEIFLPETARQFRENDQRALAEGVTIQTTEVLRQADGIDHHSIVNKFPLASPDGKPAYIAGVALDITERKRAEEALKESQRVLSTLMSSLPGMAYRCRNDKDWTMEFVSEGCVELTGYQQAGLLQNRKISYAQLIHPDDRECVWNDVQAALREERPFKLVYRISTAAGEEKWVWERGRGIFGPGGELHALEGFITDITEHKRTEDALREREQLFASFMLHMPAAAWMKDLQGRFVYANADTVRAFSTSLTGLLGKTDWDFFPPETARQFAENDRRVLSEGGNLETIEVLRQADGIEHYSLVSKFAVAGPDGKPAYIAGVAFDITEHRRLEEERSHLAAIVESSDVAIFATTLEGVIVDWNRGAEKLYGYTAAEIKGRNVSTLAPADRYDEITQNLEKVGRAEFVDHLETVRVAKDGRHIPISLSISPIKDTSGRITGASAIAHDITDRKRVQEALRESEERLRLAIDATGLGTFDYYPLTGTLIWSEGIKRHFGLPLDAPVDYGVFLAGLHPEDRKRVDGIVQHLLLSECSGDYIAEYRTIGLQDGKQRWVAARGQVFYDETGRAVRFVGTTLDISERKQAQEKIDELNTNLAESAAELALANQELEAFNFTVAHDLRNPLNVISCYCQAIREACGSQLDEQCREFLQEAYNGTLRMNKLIGALLNFSRLAHVEPRREPVDLSSMAQQVAGELKSAEPVRRVSFLIADGIAVNADANMMRVVLSNLLGNAWKYTGKREETVIEFGATEIDGQPAWFVRDNGKGFDIADADKLFAPFKRLPGAEEFRGFGIGLATVERIIRHHGGKIWAEGEPDKGATFYFTLRSEAS